MEFPQLSTLNKSSSFLNNTNIIYHFREWRKFIWKIFPQFDSIQLGQFILLVVALIGFFLMLTIFCIHLPCKCSKKSNKRRSSYLSNNNGLFICSNEERRRLLINNQTQNIPSKTLSSFKIDNNDDFIKLNSLKKISKNIQSPITLQKRNLIKSDFNINKQLNNNTLHFKRSITSNIAEQSPPPPRRLALPGGKTQVLPLTGGNQKRVSPLILLMADRENQRRNFSQQNNNNNIIQDNQNNGCETINEDIGESDQTTIISEGLLSIDRTLISTNSTIINDQNNLISIPGYLKHPNYMFRFSSSPLPKIYTPPKYEIAPPTYSPPEPPQSDEEKEINLNKIINLSTSSGTSYVINTTTTDSSDLSQIKNNNIIQQKQFYLSERNELNCNKNISEIFDAEMETLEEDINNKILLPSNSIIINKYNNEIDELPSSNLIFQNLLIGGRVPRSISQQLEMMDKLSNSTSKNNIKN